MPSAETAPHPGDATTAGRGLASQGFIAFLLVQMALGFSFSTL